MIPFYIPHIDEKMRAYMQDCLASGWLNSGPWVQRFEDALLAYCGADAVMCTSSNTTGLELCLRWWGIGPGDEVIVPAYSYCVTAHVVLNLGARPIFWDCGEDLLPDAALLADLLTPATKAVIAVDLAGLPAAYSLFYETLSAWAANGKFQPGNIIQTQLGRPLLIADAAHSIGANAHGVSAGCMADLSVFSFHSAKNITTGDGGAIAFHLPASLDTNLAIQWFRMASLHGKSKMAEAGNASGNAGYDVLYPGIKANLTDFQAAMGLAQLERYASEILPIRKDIAEYYHYAFSDHPFLRIPYPPASGIQAAYHIYPLLITGITEAQRDGILMAAQSAGIGLSVHYKPVPAFSLYLNLGYKPEDYPVSTAMSACEITLPLYEDLSRKHQEQVIEFIFSRCDTLFS